MFQRLIYNMGGHGEFIGKLLPAILEEMLVFEGKFLSFFIYIKIHTNCLKIGEPPRSKHFSSPTDGRDCFKCGLRAAGHRLRVAGHRLRAAGMCAAGHRLRAAGHRLQAEGMRAEWVHRLRAMGNRLWAAGKVRAMG